MTLPLANLLYILMIGIIPYFGSHHIRFLINRLSAPLSALAIASIGYAMILAYSQISEWIPDIAELVKRLTPDAFAALSEGKKWGKQMAALAGGIWLSAIATALVVGATRGRYTATYTNRIINSIDAKQRYADGRLGIVWEAIQRGWNTAGLLGKARASDPVHATLILAHVMGDTVMVTLDDHKVYIGFVLGTPKSAESPSEQGVSLAPIYSGYRDSETHEFTITTDYLDTLAIDDEYDALPGLQDIGVHLMTSKIHTLSIFDMAIWNRFKQQSKQAPKPQVARPPTTRAGLVTRGYRASKPL